MYRIGILGSENSHASAFSEIFNKPDENGAFKYPDCHVVAVGGHYPESNKEVFEKFGLDFIAEKPEDMLGKVDAVMVTARDGKFHPEFARPFVEAGLPMFIDKPFAVDPAEALALARLAKSKNVPLVGGSSVKQTYDVRMMQHTVKSGLGGIHGGCVAAPVSMHNDYSGFFFYSSHLAEMSLTIFGYDPKAVTAFRNGDDVTVVVEYDKYTVTNHFMEGCYNAYHCTIFGKDRNVCRDIDISMCYQHECEDFAAMLHNGTMSHTYKQLITPVYYLNAIYESYNTGKTVKIEVPEV